MAEQPTLPVNLAPVTRAASGGDCQVCVDLRPDGFTFLAHVQLPPAEEPDSARRLLDGVLRRVDSFRQRFREQLDGPVVEVLEVTDPYEENQRLRAALEGCVAACEPLLERADESSCCEGCEGDHARAWLALDEARRVLAEASRPALEARITPVG